MSSKWDFYLFINDNLVYKGNYFDSTLISGMYKIEAYLTSAYDVLSCYKKNVNLNKDTSIEFNQIFPFKLKTKPDDAQIIIDSVFFGYSPIYINLLFQPKHLIIRKEGILERSIDLTNYKNYEFEFNLSKKLMPQKKNLFNIKYISLTSTIISGILAAYYKQQANKYYYKQNRTPEDLNRVKKYDNYSAVFTIGMEINFGIFVYVLLKE